MINQISLEKAKEIMGDNFINPLKMENDLSMYFEKSEDIPEVPYSSQELMNKKNDYYLILGVDTLKDGSKVTIRNLRNIFGIDPKIQEPCFYNQDWYDKEEFIDVPMYREWFFVRKNVYEDSRAVQPETLVEKYEFPSAIKCVYSFFVVWLCKGEKLWYHDFVWCSDKDHNGDRIYVGKYHDVDGINKNGFSIHRHLALRSCYGCID